MRIDSHQHFWRVSRGDYGWLTAAQGELYRDFLPADLAPLLAAHGIAGTILVQAAQSPAETRFLIEIAAQTAFVRGVVGWADLGATDAPATIADLAKHPILVGLRPMLQDLPDRFILATATRPGLTAMVGAGLCFDALVRPRHLPAIIELRQRFPALPIVIDHGGKPDIAGGSHREWARMIAHIAADGLTCCKLSGLATEAPRDWTTETLRPFVDTILTAFGPERVMWGSDWPVLTLAASYGGWRTASETLLAGLDAPGQAAVFGGTARRFYRLEA